MSLYLLLSFVFALAGLTQECIINQHTCSIHQVTDGTGLVCQFAPECGEYEGDRRMRGVKNITLTLTSILQGGINLTDALFPDLGVVEVFTANGREEICSSLITARDVAVFVDGRMCEEPMTTTQTLTKRHTLTSSDLVLPTSTTLIEDIQRTTPAETVEQYMIWKAAVIVLSVCLFMCCCIVIGCRIKKRFRGNGAARLNLDSIEVIDFDAGKRD